MNKYDKDKSTYLGLIYTVFWNELNIVTNIMITERNIINNYIPIKMKKKLFLFIFYSLFFSLCIIYSNQRSH